MSVNCSGPGLRLNGRCSIRRMPNVFLGLRYAVWSEEATPEEVAELANSILREGIAPRSSNKG